MSYQENLQKAEELLAALTEAPILNHIGGHACAAQSLAN